jgi:hypothetical protein
MVRLVTTNISTRENFYTEKISFRVRSWISAVFCFRNETCEIFCSFFITLLWDEVHTGWLFFRISSQEMPLIVQIVGTRPLDFGVASDSVLKSARFQVPAAVQTRSGLFWVVTQRMLVVFLPTFRRRISALSSRAKESTAGPKRR